MDTQQETDKPVHINIAMWVIFAQALGRLQRLRSEGVKFPPEAEKVLAHVEQQYQEYQENPEYVRH